MKQFTGDWRLQGQEKFLLKSKIIHSKYFPSEGNDHDHCEFCSRKFSIDNTGLNYGYHTPNRYRWICEDCFRDFNYLFEWMLVSNERKNY